MPGVRVLILDKKSSTSDPVYTFSFLLQHPHELVFSYYIVLLMGSWLFNTVLIILVLERYPSSFSFLQWVLPNSASKPTQNKSASPTPKCVSPLESEDGIVSSLSLPSARIGHFQFFDLFFQQQCFQTLLYPQCCSPEYSISDAFKIYSSKMKGVLQMSMKR